MKWSLETLTRAEVESYASPKAADDRLWFTNLQTT